MKGYRQITDQVPEWLKSDIFEENEEIIWDIISRMGNGILKGVLSSEYIVLRLKATQIVDSCSWKKIETSSPYHPDAGGTLVN